MVYRIEEGGRSFITHWFINMLAALKYVDLSEKIDVCFELDFSNESYQKESLDILSDVINVVSDTPDAIILPCNKTLVHRNGGGIQKDPKTYTFLRELFLSRVADDFDTTGYEKIYIRRNRSHLCEGNVFENSIKRRQIINENELVEKLKEFGIKSVYFEDYTVSEKIQIFNKASLVVAPQSGGLIFSLFANPKCKIVEILPPNPHQYCDQYWSICKVLDISFSRFSDVTKVDGNDNMSVPIETLSKFIEDYYTK
tara:strand:- start:5952 stop:6716 length:765 start_codon:yes stop_codon:yes gene_type:complete